MQKIITWLLIIALVLTSVVNNGVVVSAEELIDSDGAPNVVLDLRIIKVQLRDTINGASDNVNQFVVIKNYGAEVDLEGWHLELWADGVLKRKTEFNEIKLATGTVLAVVNNQELVQEFLVGDESMQYFAKPDRKQNWLYVSNGKYQLRLVNADSKTIAEVKYVLSKIDYDVRSLEVDTDGELTNNWQTLSSRNQSGNVWLKVGQLPLAEETEPPLLQLCPSENEELVGDKCLPKCQLGFQRQDEKCIPICDDGQEPANGQCVDKCLDTEERINGACVEKCSDDQERVDGVCLDKCSTGQTRIDGVCQLVCQDGYEVGYTGTCVKQCEIGYQRNSTTNRCNKIQTVEPKTCPDGYLLNPSTNRCNKVVVEEPKTCQAGYYLNPETNRCRKIPEEAVLALCPAGQYRHPETNRCRKIMFEPETCQDGYELGFNNNCVKKCEPGYERSPETNRCRKVETVCEDGFSKDPKTGICVKALADAKSSLSDIEIADEAKQIKFDWLKILNSPVSGAVAASLVFALYDKFFRK